MINIVRNNAEFRWKLRNNFSGIKLEEIKELGQFYGK